MSTSSTDAFGPFTTVFPYPWNATRDDPDPVPTNGQAAFVVGAARLRAVGVMSAKRTTERTTLPENKSAATAKR